MTNAMEPFFVLRPSPERTDLFIEDYEAPAPYDADYGNGVPIRVNAPAELRYTNAEQRRTDMLAGVYTFPVVSARFRGALAAAGADAEVEYHPVRLVNTATGEADDSYRMMNVMRHVSALDRAGSEVDFFAGTDFINTIFRLSLNLEPLQGSHIVRLEEFTELLLVSAGTRARLQEAGITGVEFLAPEQYRR